MMRDQEIRSEALEQATRIVCAHHRSQRMVYTIWQLADQAIEISEVLAMYIKGDEK